jgi:hypothetical protein
MKLELKHLAPYLPYGLKGYAEDIKLIDSITLHNVEFIIVEQPRAKPILRPLSDLTKEIEHNGEKFVPMLRLHELAWGINFMEKQDMDFRIVDGGHIATCLHRNRFTVFRDGNFQNGDLEEEFVSFPIKNQLQLFEKLFELHFDVFGLIEAGKAIDFNTINK